MDETETEEAATISPKPLEVPEKDETAGDAGGTKAAEVAPEDSPPTGTTEDNRKAEQVPGRGPPTPGGIDGDEGSHQYHGSDRQRLASHRPRIYEREEAAGRGGREQR